MVSSSWMGFLLNLMQLEKAVCKNRQNVMAAEDLALEGNPLSGLQFFPHRAR